MTVPSLTANGAASQLSFVNKSAALSGTDSTGVGATRAAPPERPPGGPGALVEAIGSALQTIGVTATSGTTSGSETETGVSEDVAQALGSFLQELMGALHEQRGNLAQGGQTAADGYGPPGGAGAGGPMEADLQSLIGALAAANGTDGADGADSADSSASALETAFKNLLTALGGSAETDASTAVSTDANATATATATSTSDTSARLATFLQSLAERLPGARASGNLVDTSV